MVHNDHEGAHPAHAPRATPRVLTRPSRVAPAARAPEARPCCPSPPSVRSSSLARPLLASSHRLCTLARALSSCGSARLGLWLAVLLPRSELELHLCQGRARAAPARAGVRGALALRRGVPAVCTVAVWAVARAVPGLSFSTPFEPEALASRMWLVGSEMRAAQCMAWAGGASEQRLAARACGRKRRTSAATAVSARAVVAAHVPHAWWSSHI